jgi:hypothetical protein
VPTVVTCRLGDYRRAVTVPEGPQVRLRAAAAIQLHPLTAEVVGAYLIADAGGPAAANRWAPVLGELGSGTPVGQALTTPLMAGLARVIYNPLPDELAAKVRDPAELCAPHLADRQAVQAHLLGAFIPACYRHAARWSAERAGPWLAFLAHHLEETIGGPDLAWWLLSQSTPFADHERATSGRFQRKPPPPTPAPVSRIHIRWPGLVAAVTAGILAGTWRSLIAMVRDGRGQSPLPSTGQIVAEGAWASLFVAVIIGLAIGLRFVRHDLNTPAVSRSLVRNDRRLSLAVIAVFAVVAGGR